MFFCVVIIILMKGWQPQGFIFNWQILFTSNSMIKVFLLWGGSPELSIHPLLLQPLSHYFGAHCGPQIKTVYTASDKRLRFLLISGPPDFIPLFHFIIWWCIFFTFSQSPFLHLVNHPPLFSSFVCVRLQYLFLLARRKTSLAQRPGSLHHPHVPL